MSKHGKQQSPSFIDRFGFFLAVELLGAYCVSKALKDAMQQTSKQSISLKWRSPCREEELGSNERGAHVFNVNIIFQLGLRDKDKSFSIRFGALISPPSTDNYSALVVQSRPWTQDDLEMYAAGTGVCVEETGPEGMANIVASSLTNFQDPKVSEFNYSHDDVGCNTGIKLVIDLYHSTLFERVKINLNASHNMRHGEVGPIALALMKDALTDTAATKNEGAKRQEPANVTMLTECMLTEWLQSKNARDGNINEEITTDQATSEVNETDHYSTQKVNPAIDLLEEKQTSQDSKREISPGSIVQNQNVNKRKLREQTLSPVPNKMGQIEVSLSTKQSTRMPVLVHGAARRKKRKKGKLTFRKI